MTSTTTRRTLNILILCPYPSDTAPSQRLKYEQYIPFLESHGYKFRVLPFFSSRTYGILYKPGFNLRKACGVLSGIVRRLAQLPLILRADGIYIHLYVCPLGPPWLEWLTCRLARAVVYDIDDMVHLLPTSSANTKVRRLKSSSRFFLLMLRAQHVITCTPALDRLVRQYNCCTSDISSTVNTDTYQPCNPYTNQRELVIGWSGSHSTAPYLHLLDAVLQELTRRGHKFLLLVMGPSHFNLPGVNVEVVPWSTSVELPTLKRMDIGLYPLTNDEWVNGKSGLKAIQYMALGIPVVASAVGCNARVVRHGHTGFLVKSDEEWISSIESLINDPNLRQRLGQQGRTLVKTTYSVQSNKNRYLTIFKNVYGYCDSTTLH